MTLPRLVRLSALVTMLALPAVAVSSVAAGAHAPLPTVHAGPPATQLDDLRLERALSAARHATTEAKLVAKRQAAVRHQRASRDELRTALNRPVYVRPVPGPVTQWYGYHPGIDIAPPFGTPVVAAHAGMVTFVGWDDGYGMHVEILQSDGYVTTYSHLSAFTVQVGQIVMARQQIGNVGSTGWSTGPHLHFEVHLPGGARMDPAVWLFAHGVNPNG